MFVIGSTVVDIVSGPYAGSHGQIIGIVENPGTANSYLVNTPDGVLDLLASELVAW